ncbi:DUF6484 domain-containing protein [Myxococcus stipitatus]|uniref:DUF6484 domain-containing protein n=1 Tax=Myxococcus stipitatus TaxID=83455 RepID=UPI003144D868
MRAPGAAEYQPILTPLVGWLVGADSAGAPLVDFEGNPSGPCVARRTVPLEPEHLQHAAQTRQEVLLTFERGNPRLPIITGLLLSDTPSLDAMLEEPTAQPAPVEAHVDGQRVVIEGTDEIVLKCGQASITLRRNGKLIIKGTYVETHSAGVNRIKGGSVQIN